MQSVYRINARDYKSNYEYFTTRKELFDLCDQHNDEGFPYLSEELMEKYNVDDECLSELLYQEDLQVSFPYILLGETTVYMR